MLRNVINAALYTQAARSIKTLSGRGAFALVIGLASCLEQYSCVLELDGTKRTFKFFDSEGQQPYSFIVNQSWLLFYFRKPSLGGKKFCTAELRHIFSSVRKNGLGEVTVKLYSPEDVLQLWKILKLV